MRTLCWVCNEEVNILERDEVTYYHCITCEKELDHSSHERKRAIEELVKSNQLYNDLQDHLKALLF